MIMDEFMPLVKPRLKLYFNDISGYGWYSVQYVGSGNPPPVPDGFDWYRFMPFMPWHLVKAWKHTKRLDEVFSPHIPLSRQGGDYCHHEYTSKSKTGSMFGDMHAVCHKCGYEPNPIMQ